MAYFEKIHWDGYDIQIVSNDSDRYFCMKVLRGHVIIPYLCGKVCFDLEITIPNRSSSKKPFTYEWALYQSADNTRVKDGNREVQFTNVKSYKAKHVVSGDMLKYSEAQCAIHPPRASPGTRRTGRGDRESNRRHL